jgi:hypothetical protein
MITIPNQFMSGRARSGTVPQLEAITEPSKQYGSLALTKLNNIKFDTWHVYYKGLNKPLYCTM